MSHNEIKFPNKERNDVSRGDFYNSLYFLRRDSKDVVPTWYWRLQKSSSTAFHFKLIVQLLHVCLLAQSRLPLGSCLNSQSPPNRTCSHPCGFPPSQLTILKVSLLYPSSGCQHPLQSQASPPTPCWAILDIVSNLAVYKDVNRIIVLEPKTTIP